MRPIVLHGHQRSITCVKYNRDGDLLFTTAKDNTPTVWYTETGERLGTYEGHQGAVWDCDVNFDCTLLATAGADNCWKIFDVQSGEQLVSVEMPTPVRCIAFSHGDKHLLAITDKSFNSIPAIHVFNLPEDIRTSKAQYNAFTVYETHEKINHAVWGPTNDTIYFCSDDGSVSVLDVQANKEIKCNFNAHKREARRICLSKDYTTLASCSYDNTGKLFDARTLEVIKTYETDKPVNGVALSPLKNHIILGGGTAAADVTNTKTQTQKFETRFFHTVFQEELGSISGHFGPVNVLQFAPDGTGFTSGGEDGFIRIHKFDSDYFELED